MTGDLNVQRATIEYRMLIHMLRLRDSYAEANPLDRFSGTDYFDKKTLDYILIRGALGDDERTPVLQVGPSLELTSVVTPSGSNKRNDQEDHDEHVISDRVSFDGEVTPLQQRHRSSADRRSSSSGSITNNATESGRAIRDSPQRQARSGWHIVESLICMTHETRAEEQQIHEAWIQYCATVPNTEQDLAAARNAVLERRVEDDIFIYSDHKGISTTLEHVEQPLDALPAATALDDASGSEADERTQFDAATRLRLMDEALEIAHKWHHTAKRRLVLHLFRAVIAVLIGVSSMFLPLGIFTLWIVPFVCFLFALLEVLYVVCWKIGEVRGLGLLVELLRHQQSLAQQSS